MKVQSVKQSVTYIIFEKYIYVSEELLKREKVSNPYSNFLFQETRKLRPK